MSMTNEHHNDEKLGPQASQLYLLALGLANSTAGFYKKKGAGHGDHATNQFMAALREIVKQQLGKDFSEAPACKGTKCAFDFYLPDERTVVEVALSLRNPTSEFERDIFKCLLASDVGLAIDTLLFICKPGGIARLEAASSRRIRELVKDKFGLRITTLELVPNYDLLRSLRAKSGQ